MDQPFLTLFIYARDESATAEAARISEADIIASKLRISSTEIARASRLLVEDTLHHLQASDVPILQDVPLGIDFVENDYQVALYSGAPEFAADGAPVLRWHSLADLVNAAESPQLIAALRSNATGEDATLSIEGVELHDGSLLLTGKVLLKNLTGALLGAILGSYGQPIALDHYEAWKDHLAVKEVEAALRVDPLISGGSCVLKEGYVLDYRLLLNHARLAYDYENAETAERVRLRICNIQVALHALGYSIARIDGVMGPNTLEAWDEFRAGGDAKGPPGEAYLRLLHKLVGNKAERVRELTYEHQRR